MKRSVAWHERILEQLQMSLARHVIASKERRELDERLEQRLTLDVALLGKQIEEANRRGVEEFDRDRLLIKRKPRIAAADGDRGGA